MMKNFTLFFSAFIFSTLLIAQTDIKLRILGGTYEDVGSTIVPLDEGGAYALGSTSSMGDGTVRGYIAYLDDDLQYVWSILTPYGSLVENIVDAEVDEVTGELIVLARKIGENGYYNTVIYRIINTGTTGEISEIINFNEEENTSPTSLVNWMDDVYVVGETEGDCWFKTLGGMDHEVWGNSLQSESVQAARVGNDTLYIAGSTVIDGVEQATIWAWGPHGNPMWARVAPDEGAYSDNYSNDIAPYEGGAILLYSYFRENDPLGHGVIRFDDGNGTPGSIVSTSGSYYVEGTRLIHHNEGLIKLAHINYNSSTGTDIVLTLLGEHGGYIESSSIGSDFNDTPADMQVDSYGRIWIIGSTFGYLNGSASICVYRIDSQDLIGFIEPEDVQLGITNDPILFNSVSVNTPDSSPLTLFPNPATEHAQLSCPTSWTLYSASGTKCLEGSGLNIDLSNIAPGQYYVKTELGGILSVVRN